jgi:hypothetical protein
MEKQTSVAENDPTTDQIIPPKEKDLLEEEHKARKREIKQRKENLEIRIQELKAAELEAKQAKRSEKEQLDQANTQGIYGSDGEPRKALISFLRNQNKTELSLISILDRKSAILIRICSTIISGLIVFHTYIDENVPMGHTISMILISGLSLALIASILATKPFGSFLRRLVQKDVMPLHTNLEENIYLLSGQECGLLEYEKAMSKVVKSQDLQIGNQVRGHYILARNNRLKSKLVDISYNLFLVTFIVASLVYVIGSH